MEKVLFLIFAVLAIGSAMGVVLARNPVHSAVFLMACFLQVAAIFVLLRSPFLAVVQVFVYVGAITVLFLFVIMMLDIRKAVVERFLLGGRLLVISVLLVLTAEMLWMLLRSRLSALTIVKDRPLEGTVMELGSTLFTEYLLPFEVISVILLVALVGAILMGKKEVG